MYKDNYEEKTKYYSNQRKEQNITFIESMDKLVFNDLFTKENISKNEFEKILQNIPVFNENIHVINEMFKYNKNIFQFIVSGANTILCQIILSKYKLFNKIFNNNNIFTNYGNWDDNNILKVKSYSNINGKHSCDTRLTYL